MTPDFVVQPEAEADISEAFRWYEDKDEGLGSEFLRMLEASFANYLPNKLPTLRLRLKSLSLN